MAALIRTKHRVRVFHNDRRWKGNLGQHGVCLTPLEQQARITTMTYESEKVALGWLSSLIQQRATWIILGLLAICSLFLRCVHLLSTTHYYILSPDSYFFHWLAGRFMAGEGPPADARPDAFYAIHSGLTYPLAYIAKAVSSVFDIPPADALDLVSKFLPPFLGVISLVIVYLAAARICDRRVGLFSALAWALMLHTVFMGASGFLDRDGLTALLLLLGALLFYLSRGWQFNVRNKDIGWLISGTSILAIEGLLYLEWSFVGAALLLSGVIVYFTVQLLLGYLDRLRTEQGVLRRLASAVSGSNWKTFALVILVNAVIAIALYHQVSSWVSFLIDMFRYRGVSTVNELQGLKFIDLVLYQLFIIPLLLGLYVALKKRSQGAIFFACWFLFFLVLSLFSKRIIFFAAPAASLVSGVGLAFLWQWGKAGQFRLLKKVGAVGLLLLLALISLITAASLGSGSTAAVDEEWQDALAYLREKTSQEAVIMTQWSWGYWILDVGQRRPLVDNGYYGYPADKLRDIALAYSASDPLEAARIMEKQGADYLIFATLDWDIAVTILSWADLHEEYHSFTKDSLFARSLSGQFESGGGLEVVYRSPDSEVVILGLTSSDQL